MLETVERVWRAQPAGSIVWLHGLGADGHDFEPLVDELELPFPVRFVFPHAPVRAVTINGGMRMRAWYDLLTFDRHGPEDEAGIAASATRVREIVEREIALGIAPGKIALGGFSQGGAVALHTALRAPVQLAGVVALSAYLPVAGTLAAQRSTASLALPIWMAHGTEDAVVPIALAEASRDHLQALGHRVSFDVYRMAHGVCAEELAELRKRLCAWLA